MRVLGGPTRAVRHADNIPQPEREKRRAPRKTNGETADVLRAEQDKSDSIET